MLKTPRSAAPANEIRPHSRSEGRTREQSAETAPLADEHNVTQTPAIASDLAHPAATTRPAAAVPASTKRGLWLRRGLIGGGLLAIVAVAVALVRSALPAADAGPQLTHTISRGTLAVTVTENGTVESSNNKEIKCMVKGGSIVLWVIETGTFVQPGDELVRLDQSVIEDNILAQKIVYENALANKITAESDVAVAEKSITEYREGTYLEERSAIEKEIFDAEQAVQRARLTLASSERMAAKGLIVGLQLNNDRFLLESARKDLQLKRTRLTALNKYKYEKELQTLTSALQAAEARLASFEASLQLEEARLEREKEQLENCVIRADAAGMVIFPSMAEWKETPDIEEGAVVREQQTLLMIPDVEKMQVKVGIHESKVDRLRVGMPAQVELQGMKIQGEVSEIAEVTRPAGWWTGNMVKYDTLIKLDPRPGLKPGMTALVDVVLAKYEDVLQIPVAAILEGNDGYCCWVTTADGIQKRALELGDSDDEFTIVQAGVREGDRVLLNPLAYVDQAQRQALRPARPSHGGDDGKGDGPSEEDQAEVAKDGKKAAKSRASAG